MQKSGQVLIFIAIIFWAIVLGGIVYTHIVYFPPYLSHLPESNKLITGEYGLKDQNFWMLAHPFAILSVIAALILNWKFKVRRKFILIALGVYALAIVATSIYFVPGLIAFADSANATNVIASEWYERGQTWQHMSWIRGAFMFGGFIMLLIALVKDEQ